MVGQDGATVCQIDGLRDVLVGVVASNQGKNEQEFSQLVAPILQEWGYYCNTDEGTRKGAGSLEGRRRGEFLREFRPGVSAGTQTGAAVCVLRGHQTKKTLPAGAVADEGLALCIVEGVGVGLYSGRPRPGMGGKHHGVAAAEEFGE